MPVEGRGLGSRPTQDVVRDRRLGMTLATPSSIQKLQTVLHAKAKEEPEYRFYLSGLSIKLGFWPSLVFTRK